MALRANDRAAYHGITIYLYFMAGRPGSFVVEGRET